jgi:hypothetical protein
MGQVVLYAEWCPYELRPIFLDGMQAECRYQMMS